MGQFKDADEVYRYLSEVWRVALKDEAFATKLGATGLKLRLNYTDPESTITVDLPGQVVVEGENKDKVDIDLFMTADAAHRFWLGKLNPTVALAKGTVRVKGPVPSLLKLVPLLKELFPRYEAILRDAGRDDLLNV